MATLQNHIHDNITSKQNYRDPRASESFRELPREQEFNFMIQLQAINIYVINVYDCIDMHHWYTYMDYQYTRIFIKQYTVIPYAIELEQNLV